MGRLRLARMMTDLDQTNSDEETLSCGRKSLVSVLPQFIAEANERAVTMSGHCAPCTMPAHEMLQGLSFRRLTAIFELYQTVISP